MSEPALRPSRAQEERAERRRKPGDVVNSGLKLSVNEKLLDRENFEYRWINDDGRRIEQLTEQDDYDLVRDPTKATKGDSDGKDTLVSKVVGRSESGQPMRAYLARKPKPFYDEDQKAKAAKLDETMNSIKRGEVQTPQGAQALGQHGYVKTVQLDEGGSRKA